MPHGPMHVVCGDLWTYPADARCVTTNGVIRRCGRAVMGAGCALEARERYPGIDVALGEHLSRFGNRCGIFPIAGGVVVSFPVKDSWRDPARCDLIAASAKELVAMADANGWKRIVLPRPGCGRGQLRFDQVRPLLEDVLDGRFAVITHAGA